MVSEVLAVVVSVVVPEVDQAVVPGVSVVVVSVKDCVKGVD